MYCSECGERRTEAAKFCHACGHSLVLAEGTVLENRYRVEARLGGGEMGRLYQVWDTRLLVSRALKELVSDGDRADALRRFQAEAALLSRLRHPSLPVVQDHFSVGDSCYLVMDLIEGDSLQDHLLAHGSPGLSVAEVCAVGLEVLDILHFLHQQSPAIVHRDVKPANIVRQHRDGRLFLVDFGIARRVHLDPGTAIGTEGYAPPEQYQGKSEPRSDLYSLAATMHHLLTGQAPAVPFSFEPVAALGQPLQSLLDTALQREPKRRFPSAAHMKERLQQCVAVPGTRKRAPATAPLPTLLPTQRAVNLLCAHCRTRNPLTCDVEETWCVTRCTHCDKPFGSALLTVRNKRSRALPNGRRYKIRAYDAGRREQLIECSVMERNDMALHSGDLFAATFAGPRLSLIQNLTRSTLLQYMSDARYDTLQLPDALKTAEEPADKKRWWQFS